jgi:hypothetical protein
VSAGSRIILAAISLVCAAGFFLTALDVGSLAAEPSFFYGLAIFCVVVAIASLAPKTHPITLRMIGTIVFCGYAASNSWQSHHWMPALVGLFVCGVPAAYLALKGTYPR